MGRVCADHEVPFTISRWIAAISVEVRSQGGILSPLLWNMVIHSLLVRLNNESLWAQGFADIAIGINVKLLSTVCAVCELIRNSWLSQETSEILPSDGVIFCMAGRAGAGVFSVTLDIRESYALGPLATAFQAESA
jgi:hypothetical protein